MTAPLLHLAELNVGRLLAPTDDPRVADFRQGPVRVTQGSGAPGTGNSADSLSRRPACTLTARE